MPVAALEAARAYRDAARAVAARAAPPDQRTAHACAWIATLVAALEALAAWGESRAEPHDAALVRVAFAEAIGQLAGGVAMGPLETVRPGELGLDDAARRLAADAAALWGPSLAADRAALAAALAADLAVGEPHDDADLAVIRTQFRRFVAAEILPCAQRWHLADALIPDETVAAMAALGTFAVSIPAAHGGLGLGKVAMCVVTEELARGWLGAGSLGTRAEIVGELIAAGGTAAQQAAWLPGIASGAVLPAAVFTEPDTGSDLARLTTRAQRRADGAWAVSGAKTWITHAARADLMTLLVRTRAGAPGHDGLSLLLAPKPRGTAAAPFPVAGLSGSEIGVLGYRGMREYALQFDGFVAPADALLGGVEGEGFRQLMRTFEAARIQTAARGLGVARRAFELGADYARQRRQFGQPLIGFARVADKLVTGLAMIVLARELTYAAARAKDTGKRCDIEAGMAKLLAARVAWDMADAALQIHGGNGYALEFEISRVLCDARVLAIFEGAAEIQAQVIARGLREGRNR